MQMIPASLARIAAALGLALCGVAHAQGLVGSYARLDGQVVAPSSSPTLYSTHDVTGGDTVRWLQYFQSRHASPWVADGEQTVPSGHRWQAGSMRMPPNTTAKWKIDTTWTAAEPTGTVNLTAVAWHTDPMLRIDFSTTEKSTDFSGTGDGFRVIPYKKNFYVVNHHADSDGIRPLNCRTATKGENCPGFPADGKGLTFTDKDGEPLGVTTTWRSRTPHSSMDALNYATGELFVAVNANGGTYVVCTNLDSLRSCGTWLLGPSPGGIAERNVNLETFGSKYYVLDNTGALFCFDYEQKKSCGTTQYTLGNKPGSMHQYTSTQLDGKMFFNGPTRMWCHDPSTGKACAGWNGADGWPMGTVGGVIPIPDAVGAPRGVCAGDPDFCRTVTGATFTLSKKARDFLIENRSWVMRSFSYVYSVNFNAVDGSRIFMPRTTSNGAAAFGLHCFDFSKDATCANFPRFTTKNDRAYTVRFDPTRPDCLLMLGDAAIAYQLNINTLGACSDPGSATDPKTLKVTPADHYRCDPTNAAVTAWDKIRVTPTMTWGGLSGLSQIRVTLRDANGALLPAALKPNRTFDSGQFTLDISDIPYTTYPTLTITYQMFSAGLLYSSASVGVDVTWQGPPRQVCFETKVPTPATCEAGSTLTITTALAQEPAKVLETIVVDKVMWSGAGAEGYAAAAAATSTRALSGALTSGETRTFLLQGRYDLKNFSGDLWSMGLTGSLKIAVDAIGKMSSSVTAAGAGARPMYLSKSNGGGTPGAMSIAPLGWANANPGQRAALNRNLAGLDDGQGEARLGYLRGTDGMGFRTRSGGPLGPVINSAPTVIPERAIAGLSEANHPGWTKYRREVSRPDPMVIWGGNDGAVHAAVVKSDGLTEAWSLVPDAMLRQAARYSDTTIGGVRLNPYFVDAQPMVGHANIGGGSSVDWRTVAVVPFGRGARGLIAIDVTKTEVTGGKGVLFEYSNTSDPELADLGYIVSPPIWSEALGSHQIVKLADGRWAVLVGNGIDSNDTRGGEAASGPGRPVLYAFYLDNAKPRWRRWAVDEITGTGGDPAVATNNGLSAPRPVDTDGDGRVDIVYAGDIKGNLWRFDLKSVSSPSVSKLYAAGPTRPIHTAPLAVRNGSSGACPPSAVNGCWQVIVGTGAYMSPLMGTTNAATQQFVGLIDLGQGTTVSESTLVTQAYSSATNGAGIEFRVADGAPIDYIGGKRGWKMALGAKEHAVAPPLLQPNGQLRVTTVRPIVAPAGGGACLPARSWVFETSPISGPPTADTFDYDNDGLIDERDRVKIGGTDTRRPPMAMAVSGAQFSTPQVLLGPKVSSSTAYLVFPSLNVDTSTSTAGAAGKNNPALPGQAQPSASGLAGVGDRKVLGRASWRLVK